MKEILLKTIRDRDFKLIDSTKKGAWVNHKNATTEELHEIAQITGLEYDDVKDVLDEYEIPRIERHGTTVIIFLRTPLEKGADFTETLAIIVTPEYLFTISPQENALVEGLKVSISRKNMATTQTAKFLLSLLLRLATRYTQEIKKVTDTVGKQRKRFKDISDRDIADLVQHEEILNQYLAALVPTRSVFEAIIGGGILPVRTEEDKDLLQDLLIAIKQSVEVCSVNLKSIRSVRDAHQILFTNDLNRTIKFLTSFTIILTIPTIVSSIYGMNVRLPFDQHPFAFFLVLGIAVSISALMWVVFLWRRWL